MGRCLVERWGRATASVPDLALLRRWGVRLWNLKEEVSFSNLGSGLFLAEFEAAVETERVLRRGIQCFGDKVFHLERWGPEVGCSRAGVHVNHCWVRVVGFPLHFWNWEVFRKLGDSCGGFIVVNDEATNFVQLQWARLLVRSKGKDLLGML